VVVELPSSKRLAIGGEGFFLLCSASEVVVNPVGKHGSGGYLELVHGYDRLTAEAFG
jgi:hypothetical protein